MSNIERSESLEPQNWVAMKKLAYKMVDDAFEYLQNAPTEAAWQALPPTTKAKFETSVPLEPQGAAQAYQDFKEDVMPFSQGTVHPRFWGWFTGAGNVMGALGDFLAAITNSNLIGGPHAPVLVENQVIDWCKEMLDYPKEASGLMVSGASMANLLGLAVARNQQASFDQKQFGMQGASNALVFYASSEGHSCLERAAELMGLGKVSLRKIAVNSDYQMDLTSLKNAIADDRKNGFIPFSIVATAGTTNTGSIDDLNGIADICQQEKLWFHVDGAIGGFLKIAPKLKSLVAGIERADSVALDLHKWMQIPYEAGVALVKHKDLHQETFAQNPTYLERATRGLAAGDTWFGDYGIQTSRGFKALKVWLSFKEHGINKYGRLMEKNVDQANYFANLLKQETDFEIMAPMSLNIVCFRFSPQSLSTEELNALNKELMMRLHESGIAIPSYTTLAGKYCLRVAVANHRSTFADFDLFFKEMLHIAHELIAEDFLASLNAQTPLQPISITSSIPQGWSGKD